MAASVASELCIYPSTAAGSAVVVGCPFPAKSVSDQPCGAVVRMEGRQTPAQVVPLTPPTPAGVRWVELSFVAPASGCAEVTLGPVPAGALIAADAPGQIVLDNGLVRVAVHAEGVAVLHISAGKAIGTCRPQVVLPMGKVCRDSTIQPRSLTLLRNGPLRAQAELYGVLTQPDGKPALSYRLTVELWKDRSAARIDWMLSHLVPGQPTLEVQSATLQTRWHVGANARRRFIQDHYSEFYVRRQVDNPDRVEIATDQTCGPVHVTDPAMLLDDKHYAHYLTPPTISTSPWLGLVGDDAAVYATIGDFTAMRPTSLDSVASQLDWHFLPPAPGHPVAWPQGRRRQQTLLLGFAADDTQQARAIQHMSDAFITARATPSARTLAELRCFDQDRTLPYVPGRNVRLTMLMHRLCHLNTTGDKWNLGDTPDTGYTHTYPPTPNSFELMPGAPQLPRRYNPAGNTLLHGIEGAFVEPVWTNNEYDVIHTIALEHMRTGKDDLADMLRWTARHNIEVDFVALSDDPWHHRGIPFHSRHHNTKGVISSHLWTQGLLEYYCLSGDRDALEVAHALGAKIIELDHNANTRTWKFDREVGWALLSLTCLLEAGFTQYREEADLIGQYLQEYDRTAFSGMVNLSGTRTGRTLERQMIDSGFGYASLVEAMDRWQQVTGRADTVQWLKTLSAQLLAETWNAVDEGEVPGVTRMVPLMLAIGYERTGDRRYIEAGLVMLDVFFDPAVLGEFRFGEVKPCAMAYRALYRYAGHAQRLGLLDRFEYPGVLARQ